MPRELHNTIFEEIEFQIQTRRAMAIDRQIDYSSDDPINSLPLTEYQKGLVAGRRETWEFMEKLMLELKDIYRKKEAEKAEAILQAHQGSPTA